MNIAWRTETGLVPFIVLVYLPLTAAQEKGLTFPNVQDTPTKLLILYHRIESIDCNSNFRSATATYIFNDLAHRRQTKR